MKITHKKTLLFFLLLIASIFNSYLFSQADYYRKTIHVTTKGQVIPLEQCYYNKLPRKESYDGITRFVVDNGVEFFIKLPEDIVVDEFSHDPNWGERSVLQGNMIKILGNGTLTLFFYNNKKELYFLYLHVNYKGVLQYKGQNAPEEIEVSEENENETLSVPNNSFAATLWSFSTNKSSGFTDFYESIVEGGHKPSFSLKIKDIIKSSLSKIDIVNGELIIKTDFVDYTSNAIYKDEKKEDIIAGGASSDFVILKIKNKAKRLDLSTEEVNFTNYGGSQTVEVATDHSYGYTVTKEKDCYWLDVVKEGNTIKINARSNGTASNLESFITVRSVGITKKIKVTMQASATQIDVGYTSLSFPVEGGSNDVSVVSNANWKVYSDVDWIKAHDNYFMLNSISLEVDKNLSGERIGHVIIEANGVKKTITIFQEGKPAVLDISTNSMVFNNGGELKEAKVNSNTNCDVTTDSKWLTINPKKGKGDDFIQIYAEPNESDLQRKAKVTISGGVSKG